MQGGDQGRPEGSVHGPPYGENKWHLYNLRDDPQELTNVAAEHPGKFAEMLAEWEAYSRAVGYIEASGDKILAKMSPEDFFSQYGLQPAKGPLLGDD